MEIVRDGNAFIPELEIIVCDSAATVKGVSLFVNEPSAGK